MQRVTGWALDRKEREALLKRFPPRYARTVADHVTWAFEPSDPTLPTATAGEIVGEADDGVGVQALVVRIDGITARPDGSIFHITWSLAPGRRAVESNDVIRDCGWAALAVPAPVALRPARFP